MVQEGKLVVGKRDGSQAFWDVTADGQVKHGNMCFVATDADIGASDCNEAAAVGGDKFFEVAVPASDPTVTAAVRAMGSLLRASSKRQRCLLASLQSLLPQLATCKVGSFANLEKLKGAGTARSLASTHVTLNVQGQGSVAAKVAQQFGMGSAEVAQLIAESADSLHALS